MYIIFLIFRKIAQRKKSNFIRFFSSFSKIELLVLHRLNWRYYSVVLEQTLSTLGIIPIDRIELIVGNCDDTTW